MRIRIAFVLGSAALSCLACGSIVEDQAAEDGSTEQTADVLGDHGEDRPGADADADAPPHDDGTVEVDDARDGETLPDDGATDGCVEEMSGGEVCDGSDPDLCEEGRFYCVGGEWVCSDGPDTFPEVCDGVDNDCDLETDEGFDLGADPRNCGGCGIVCTGARPTCCDAVCRDVAVDDYHCGACGATCTVGGWRFRCCDAVCHDLANCENHCNNPGVPPCLRVLCACDG
jgi:hypothetical protein